jgi:two-component system KDP operon response regulator KdpE
MPAAKPRILIADDEPKYLRSLTLILQAKGYEVVSAPDGEAAVALAAFEAPALMLLDVRIPKLDGCEVCRQIRLFSLAPILLVTAMGHESDIVAGLEAGADDYVVKPFVIERLLARVETILGWNALGRERPAYELGALKVDYAQHQVSMAQRPVPLTPAEFRLLAELAQAEGSLPSEVLLESVWGPEQDDIDQFVPVFIRRLRQKIEVDPDTPEYILAQPGHRYRLGRTDHYPF